MRFGHSGQDDSGGIQLAPLIDIVFLILVFFMTTAVFTTLERKVDIKLPTADQSKQDERSAGEIYINLRADGQIIVNDRQLSIDELQDVLNRVAQFYPGGAVIIRGDRQAMLGRAVAILNCCKNADIDNVSFAALKEEIEEST